jgi:imidazole glycerol-phosphate synthase subunit HisH
VKPSIAILDYDSGNLRSVATAVRAVGGVPVITADPVEALRCPALIVPGVGAFGSCVRALRARGLDGAIVRAAISGRPVLGVCVGMQVLFERSEESPDVAGLGLFPGFVRRLPGGVKVPHVGWNEVRWTSGHPLRDGLPDGVPFYFVHSYAADASMPAPQRLVGSCEHGRTFAAAVSVGSVTAVQFHPERSGDAGLALYEAFVASAR